MSSETVMGVLRPDLVDRDGHKYKKSRLASTYDRDEGLLTIPVCGPAGTAAVLVRVHAPVGTRKVDFEYIREGSPPVFPAPADAGGRNRTAAERDVILSSAISFPAPTEIDGTLIFSVRGSYHYLQPEGGRNGESIFPIDAHPFPSLVHILGTIKPNGIDPNKTGGVNTWRSDVIDARVLCGYNIIG